MESKREHMHTTQLVVAIIYSFRPVWRTIRNEYQPVSKYQEGPTATHACVSWPEGGRTPFLCFIERVFFVFADSTSEDRLLQVTDIVRARKETIIIEAASCSMVFPMSWFF